MAQPSRILRPIDNSRRIPLAGSIHPRARAEYDQGPMSRTRVLTHVTVSLAQSASQSAALEQLLNEQQTPGSANYHKWLTPEEYAQRFGVSDADLSQIVGWLQAQGLTIAAVARGRNWVAVNGTVAQMESAFQTQLHNYLVNGEMHFANATAPTVPAALAGVVQSIHGLSDFRMKPATRALRQPAAGGTAPHYTSSKGNHYLSPDDLAVIYNMKGLYNAGIDGTGQKVVIAGQTQIDITDIQQFRSTYGLPANDPNVLLIPGTQDPGKVNGDLAEADLDIEWSGAVARNATITYVYSQDVMQSVQYAIDQNLAPVVSTSYGLCEPEMPTSEILSLRAAARQANALGITWFSASGDAGGADCSDSSHTGLAVDVPAAIPEVTGVGGTTFNEGSGAYWNSTNDANRASVISYIPEVAWNDSAIDGSPSATGGGASTIFGKPAWQTGVGVPSGGARYVPDISLAASADHDGYLAYSGGSLGVYGGTSVPTPAFAGIAALLNQYLVSTGAQSTPGLGNINPNLYALAQVAPGAFHDITTGDNIVTVTCATRSRNCVSSGPVGFSAGTGYDQATGLGSVDVYQLATLWTRGSQSGPRSSETPVITGLANGASFQQTYAPGMILSVFGSQLSPATQIAGSVPLPQLMSGVSATVNGVSAPLYYVSSTQLNIQVPYEAAGGTAVLTVNNNGQTASQTFQVAGVAPGIFMDQSGAPVPYGSASRGQVITLYVTGAGAVAPAVATGSAPSASTPLANLPAPAQGLTVTVGNVQAPLTFVGIPPGLVGVVQVNYQVPTTAPLGAQSVVVKVGGVSSQAAKLVVQ